MIFLFMLYMTIIIYGSTMMRGVVEEKSSRVIEVLLSSTNSFHLMIGKLFGVGSVGLVQYIIWVSMGMVTFIIATQTMPILAEFINVSPIILLYFILFFVIACAGEPVKIDLPENHPANPKARETAFIPPPNPFQGHMQVETDGTPRTQKKRVPSHQHQMTHQMGKDSMPTPKPAMEMEDHQHQEHKK